MSASSNKCSFLLLDFRTNKRNIDALSRNGYSVLLTKKLNSVCEAISGHADIQICKVGSKYICEPTVYDYYRGLIKDEYLIIGKKELKKEYPEDIAYNICTLDNFAIHNFKYTDTVVSEELKLNFYNLINVKQGYSKCSICKITENAFITADENIYRNAIQNNFDVLKINPGYIKLEGFEYGFLGGATGLIEKNILAVNGTLKKHPDYNNIKSFCSNYNIDILELSNETPVDIGSILKLDSNSVK